MAKLTLTKPLSPETQEKLAKLINPPPKAEAKQAKEAKEAKPAAKKKPPSPPKKAAKPVLSEEEKAARLKEDQETALRNLNDTKAWLEATFPEVFDFAHPKPLKLGIHRDILAAHSGHPAKTQIRKALKHYTQSVAYRQALLAEEGRYNLKGEKVEEITQGHKTYAQKKLDSVTSEPDL